MRDPDVVELEYPTIDGKSVDYALKVNQEPVLLLEAKQLKDSLEDVKAITQVVGYAANDGVEWCVLTNGICHKVYKSSEPSAAPDKLLFEVSMDPKDPNQLSLEQVASHLSRFSRDSLAAGILDELGEEIFTTAKVRKALDRLFSDPPQPVLRAIRREVGDNQLTPSQVRTALGRIWRGVGSHRGAVTRAPRPTTAGTSASPRAGRRAYDESHHTGGKPTEVVELYRALDRICQDLAPGEITRRYLAKYVSWSIGKQIFCSAHLQQSGLRVWVKLDPKQIPLTTHFARDVSRVGHWGVGDVELAIDGMQRLRDAQEVIRLSYGLGRER